MGNIKMTTENAGESSNTTPKTPAESKTNTGAKNAGSSGTPKTGTTPKPADAKKGGNTMLWIIIALVVVAVIGVAVYFMTKKKAEPAADKSAGATAETKEGGDIELYFAKDLTSVLQQDDDAFTVAQ